MCRVAVLRKFNDFKPDASMLRFDQCSTLNQSSDLDKCKSRIDAKSCAGPTSSSNLPKFSPILLTVRSAVMWQLRGLIFFAVVSTCGCVSVSLPENSAKRATGVKFQAPTGFHAIPTNGGDAAWKSPATGNVISFLTDCGSPSRLTVVRDDVIHGLNQSQITQERNLTVDNQQALRSLISQKSDKVETLIDLVVFNKGDCSYVLTLIGKAQSLTPDVSVFESFLGEFHAP